MTEPKMLRVPSASRRKKKKTDISLEAEKAALKGKVPDNMLNQIAQKNVNNKLKRAAADES